MSATITTPADILDLAADVIVRNGWTRDQFYSRIPGLDPRQCPVCAGGGINVAAGYLPTLDEREPAPTGPCAEAVQAFARHVYPDFGAGHDLGRPYATIGTWNDGIADTAEQVVAELRACAANLRKEAA